MRVHGVDTGLWNAINAQQLQLFDPVTKNTSSGFGYINPSQVAGGLRPREGLVITRLRF
jgi:hypothetical protein